MQSRTSNLESCVVKGTGNLVKEVASKKLLPKEGDIRTYKNLNKAESVSSNKGWLKKKYLKERYRNRLTTLINKEKWEMNSRWIKNLII
ncbi:hypothetical protein [Bacillus wiedmannii]|uniref:hypothetical protein n=1 Tax=Bacillus wiedmannii TaxID=1890302 RepID=UPI00077A8F46|nr:hypothetical protein [Bacillus wiedmannii]KXY06617.1 hypothetical protein AT260_17660 [Bacillus wiedmannii]OAK26569.1 hypothetical protein A6281_17190 [Bacillus wiedmannii]